VHRHVNRHEYDVLSYLSSRVDEKTPDDSPLEAMGKKICFLWTSTGERVNISYV